MTTGEHETLLDAADYLRTLSVDQGYTEVYETDGASLFRIGDDHFVVLETVCEHKHMGHAMLRRVLPPHWSNFHTAINQVDRFRAYHYGPEL